MNLTTSNISKTKTISWITVIIYYLNVSNNFPFPTTSYGILDFVPYVLWAKKFVNMIFKAIVYSNILIHQELHVHYSFESTILDYGGFVRKDKHLFFKKYLNQF